MNKLHYISFISVALSDSVKIQKYLTECFFYGGKCCGWVD